MELVLLCVVAVIAAAGALMVCHAFDVPLHHATRLILVPGAVILATFLLDRISPNRDHVLIPCVLGLSVIGLIELWRLELGGVGAIGSRGSRQLLWMLLGAGAMVGTYGLVRDVRRLSRYKYLCGVGAIALIILTMIWGVEINGARLWLGIKGIFVFQPTELAKILLCVFLAGYVASKGDMLWADGRRFLGISVPEMRYLAPVLGLVLFSLAMFVSQRDLGAAALVFGILLTMVYLATGRKTYVALGALFFAGGGFLADRIFPHVHRRMEAWLNPWAVPDEGGWQLVQSLICFGEGGLTGVGLGRGIPPVESGFAAHTDLILAIIGEELGFAGVAVVLLLGAMVVYRGFCIAWRSSDRFGSLLAAALSTAFGLQMLVIAGGVTKLVPLTGITFPFVSYGGTSLLFSFIAIGLLLCISRDCLHTGAAQTAVASRE